MKGRSLPVILGVVLAGAVGVWFYLRSEASHEAFHFREIATHGLAEFLARTFPKQQALVVSNPFIQKRGQPRSIHLFEEAGWRGLRKGLGTDKVIVAYPELQPGALENPHSVSMPAASTTPVAWLLAERAFDKLAHKHPNCELIISLIGLPPDLTHLNLWQDHDGPKLAFLLPDLWMLGDKEAILGAFKTGKIAAVILNKPGVLPEHASASTGEFTHHYLLVTPDNIEDMMKTYPHLFEASEAMPQKGE